MSEAIADIGYEGIVAFDQFEPEYNAIKGLYREFEDIDSVQLLVTCATTQEFQLNGDAQAFWRTLTEVSIKHDSLNSITDVEAILWKFMEESVNARMKSIKNTRLEKLLNSGFPEWFLANHRDVEPFEVWEQLANDIENKKQKKTVVLSMKVYDIAHLIDTGEYHEFPYDIPIPCDLQIERVSETSGIVDSTEADVVMAAWMEVMEGVSGKVGHPISLLRIDSIIWQAGQVIGNTGEDLKESRQALDAHFQEVGLEAPERTTLANELTASLEHHQGVS
ncbi:N-glycosylase/DNA lyase [Halocatena pleomorpha]|uniref:N-glycosylase/DNA lyase n=1 Tax=Halocatena pleomorpha TaxID=1785090 RepID=UPI001639CA84|nr:N-glycosylase/DNA lyase [Halocatena pleomorpha]